jgi:hypothetical protein
MSNFYNCEYLSERLAAVCKERDELREQVKRHQTIEKGLLHLIDELAKANAEKADKIRQLEAESLWLYKGGEHK